VSLPLPLGAVNRVDIPVFPVEQFAYGDNGITLACGVADNLRQGVGRVAAVVVEKNDGAGVEAAGDAPDYCFAA
jgi:hypothetical protein